MRSRANRSLEGNSDEAADIIRAMRNRTGLLYHMIDKDATSNGLARRKRSKYLTKAAVEPLKGSV